jgi:U4/U6.U5 tri-snRNP component SNU23
MADSKQGAYATKAADTDFRRKWDKEEYAEKARKKDDEERERMQENEERMKQGTERVMYNTPTDPQANHLGSIYH